MYLAIIMGVILGIFTGLIPGIHINLISALILSFSTVFLSLVSPLFLVILIISMAITHTFLDSIPSIYLGAPDEAQALSVLPGHRMLNKGLGHHAIVYTLIGSFLCLIIAIILFPLFTKMMLFSEPIIKNYVGYILIIIIIFMVLREKEKWIMAFIIVLLSGTLGLIVLNIPNLSQPLFPLLSGLFGVSILYVSLNQNNMIPKQKESSLKFSKTTTIKATTAATGVGFIAAFLPGFGSSQAAILAQGFVGDLGDEGFLTLVGGINTANMLISIITAYTLNKARNGAILVAKELIEFNFDVVLYLISAALITGGIAFYLGVKISKIFSGIIVKINYRYLIIGIILFIVILSIFFDSYIGLLILLSSTSLGILTSELGVGKNHLMACLIVPVIFFFIL